MSGRDNLSEPVDEAVTPNPGPVAPPSFGKPAPEDHKPGLAVPLFGPAKPWWAASPDEEAGEARESAEVTEDPPAREAAPAGTTAPTPTGPVKATRDVLVAGHGAPGVDTRGAVPVDHGPPSPDLNDTNPDGIPSYPSGEPEPTPEQAPDTPPNGTPAVAPQATAVEVARMPDAILPPGVTPGAHLLVAGEREAAGRPVTVTLVPGPMLRPAEQSGPGTGPMPTVGSVFSGGRSDEPVPPTEQAVKAHNRRALAIGGLVAAAILVPATVFAIVGATSGSSSDEENPPKSAQGDPSAAPRSSAKPSARPVNINSEKTDTRPLALKQVYGAREMGLGPRYFLRDRALVNNQCELTANGAMAAALETGKCRSVVRATYINVRKTLAVTAGVVVMPTAKAALRVDKAGDPSAYEWFRGLPGKRSPDIDQGGGYASSTVRGRYLIYAYATPLEGTAREDDAVLKEVAEQFIAYSVRPIDQRAAGRS
jgi:hypothetical protein